MTENVGDKVYETEQLGYEEFETLDEFVSAFRWGQHLLAKHRRLSICWRKSNFKKTKIRKKFRDKFADNHYVCAENLTSELMTLCALNRKFKDQVEIDWKNIVETPIKKKG